MDTKTKDKLQLTYVHLYQKADVLGIVGELFETIANEHRYYALDLAEKLMSDPNHNVLCGTGCKWQGVDDKCNMPTEFKPDPECHEPNFTKCRFWHKEKIMGLAEDCRLKKEIYRHFHTTKLRADEGEYRWSETECQRAGIKLLDAQKAWLDA